MDDEKNLSQATSDELDNGIKNVINMADNARKIKNQYNELKNDKTDKSGVYDKNKANKKKRKNPSDSVQKANEKGKNNNGKDTAKESTTDLKSKGNNGVGKNIAKKSSKGKSNGSKKAAKKKLLKLIMANPPIAIALIGGIVLIVFIFLVAAFFSYLTEGGVLLALISGIKNAVLAVLSEVGVAVTSFLTAIKDLLGFDGHFGYDNVSTKIEVSTDLYDENDSIQVGYVRMYEMEAQVLRNAYTHAIYVDMKAKAKKEGWDYSELLDAATNKYGEEDGWKEVYSTQNYAMLAEVLDFGLDSGVYGGTYEAGTEEAVEAIRKYFLDDMFQGDDTSLMQQFYYLNYTEETDSDGNTYIQPHIYPYTWKQIYGMLGIDMDATEKDSNGASSGITYYDRQKAAYEQARGNCEDGNGNKLGIYDLLQLDNFYDIMDYVNESGEPIDNQSVEDIILNDLLASEEVPFDTSEWYNDVTNNYSGSTSYEIWDGWMYMYATPTMAPSINSYFVNLELAVSDIYADLESMDIEVPSSSGWCNYEFGTSSWKTMMQGIPWQKGAGGAAVYNNRYLVALAPGIYIRDYWSTTGGIGYGTPVYGTKAMDLVLKNKETEKVYYVPICQGDTKAHTFPYGIVQTGMHIPNSKTLETPVEGANFGKDFYYTDLGLASDYKSVCKNYNKLLIDSGSAWKGIKQMLKGGPIEWCYKNEDMDISALNKEFTLMGVIVY